MAIAFEGALLVVADLGGVLLGVPFMDRWDWSWEAVGWGVLACIPLWGVFYESVHNESKSLREIRLSWIRTSGPCLSDGRLGSWHYSQ